MTHVIDFDHYRAKVRRERADMRSRRLTKAFANRRQSGPDLRETMETVGRNMSGSYRGGFGHRGPGGDAA